MDPLLREQVTDCCPAVEHLMTDLKISRRKAQTALGVHAGLSEGAIADWLGCSSAVVHTHTQRLYATGLCGHSYRAIALLVERSLTRGRVSYRLGTELYSPVTIHHEE